MNLHSICVFCGAQNAVPQAHLDVGKQLGEYLADNNQKLVYGGGDCGIMGAVANGTMNKGGWVTGVFPRHLRNIENEHQELSEIIMVDSMHERKQIMYEKSDAFVILPGGFGTMDEMFEIITWRQIQLHEKPVFIFNHLGYWDHLVSLMDGIITAGFAREVNREYYTVAKTFDELTALISA